MCTSDAPVVDPQKTVVSSVISREQIQHLPINGRSFIGFSLLAPAVVTDRTPQQGASGTSGLSFAGQRARSNNITVDGLDNNDSTIGSVRATFSQEAVREFQVLTNSYSAEFGKASGGVVNIVTKSGTNTMAGNLFFFLRDSALNSKDHFERFDPAGQPIDREKAPYSQKQYGGTLGGPIRRDRTFYFLSYERLDIAAHNFVTIDGTNNVTFLGQNYGTPAQILGARRLPGRDGACAVRHPLEPGSRKNRSPAESESVPDDARQLGERSEREHRAVWRQRGAQPRRRAREQRPDVRVVASVGRLGEDGQRNPFPDSPPRSDDELPRPEVPGRRLHTRGSGRADPGSARRRERGAPEVYAAAAQERALPGARHRQLCHRGASVQGRVRLQLHQLDQPEPSAAFWWTVYLRQYSRRAGAAARACRRSRFRRSSRCSSAFPLATCKATAILLCHIPTATFRYLPRTTGESTRDSPRSSAFDIRCRHGRISPTTSPATRVSTHSRAMETTSRRGLAWCGIRWAIGRPRCTGPTGCISTTSLPESPASPKGSTDATAA